MESRGRGPLPRCEPRAERRVQQANAPLYKRLPPGPHRLERSEVVRHQRLRMHGAMVEALAQVGYERASVKLLVALAGVSRRSFYEQFDNKHACFLATFDVIAEREIRRLRSAYTDADGACEERLRATFMRLAESLCEDRKALRLVLLDAPAAGPSGTLRLRRALGACEQLFAGSIAGGGERRLPAPVISGLGGAVHGVLAAQLREHGRIDRAALVADLMRWTLPFTAPCQTSLSDSLAARFRRRARELSRACGARHAAPAPGLSLEQRVAHSTLWVLTRAGHRQLSLPEIAEHANVPVEILLELHGDRDECLQAALSTIAGDLREVSSDPALTSREWPQAVARAVEGLMRLLAERPLYARTLAQEAYCAGPAAAAWALTVAEELAGRLTAGATDTSDGGLLIASVAGAVVHTIRCQVAGGRVELLPAFSDCLTYAILLPLIGADEATEIVTAAVG